MKPKVAILKDILTWSIQHDLLSLALAPTKIFLPDWQVMRV